MKTSMADYDPRTADDRAAESRAGLTALVHAAHAEASADGSAVRAGMQRAALLAHSTAIRARHGLPPNPVEGSRGQALSNAVSPLPTGPRRRKARAILPEGAEDLAGRRVRLWALARRVARGLPGTRPRG
jgi:hypothetical protein